MGKYLYNKKTQKELEEERRKHEEKIIYYLKLAFITLCGIFLIIIKSCQT